MTNSKIDPQTIETPLLRVPYESLKRVTKDRKQAIEEYADVIERLARASQDSAEERNRHLKLAESRLGSLKRKLEAVAEVEVAELQRCRARLQHLISLGSPGQVGLLDWNRGRLDRILAEHLMRRGHMATAAKLVAESGLNELVDSHIFVKAQSVAAALDRRDCGPALEWCGIHAAKLRKSHSQVLFKLRLQEFVELVRKQDTKGAIKYARAHLAAWAEPCEEEHQRVFAALIFTSATTCPIYQELFSDERWDALKELFLSELYRLHSLTPSSILNIHLQAGLSAIKLPQSLEHDANQQDPLHLPDFRALAADLPFSKHTRSKLVCAITHTPINEDNPPLVTPAGACYSEVGVKQVADKNDGIFVDPFSGAKHKLSEMTRAYIS